MKIARAVRFCVVETPERGRDVLQEIPEDMLCYDAGFVHPAHPGVVAFPAFRTKTGVLGGTFTPARWQSFARPITEVLDKERLAALRAAFEANASGWITYRPYRHFNGTVEYGHLVPITLQRWLDAKDAKEV